MVPGIGFHGDVVRREGYRVFAKSQIGDNPAPVLAAAAHVEAVVLVCVRQVLGVVEVLLVEQEDRRLGIHFGFRLEPHLQREGAGWRETRMVLRERPLRLVVVIVGSKGLKAQAGCVSQKAPRTR